MAQVPPDVVHYLESAQLPIRLACTTESGWPVVLSLWYLFEDGQIYCATHAGARVVRYLRANPECAFEVAGDLPPYCGVRGQGRATLEPALGFPILRRLLERYHIRAVSALAQSLLAADRSEVAIVIEPVNWYTWNFSHRMRDAIREGAAVPQKVCP